MNIRLIFLCLLAHRAAPGFGQSCDGRPGLGGYRLNDPVMVTPNLDLLTAEGIKFFGIGLLQGTLSPTGKADVTLQVNIGATKSRQGGIALEPSRPFTTVFVPKK